MIGKLFVELPSRFLMLTESVSNNLLRIADNLDKQLTLVTQHFKVAERAFNISERERALSAALRQIDERFSAAQDEVRDLLKQPFQIRDQCDCPYCGTTGVNVYQRGKIIFGCSRCTELLPR
jgi:hypothetical protein